MGNEQLREILGSVEPLDDSAYGPRYRCSVRLKDGTALPCVALQSKDRLVGLARRRFSELANDNELDSVVASFVAGGNRVNDYDIESATISRFAIPLSLLRQIRGETSMAWTGWVFEMNDGHLFSYGSTFLMEFFQLPDGYDFTDVLRVHNHSYVDADGTIASYREHPGRPTDLYRERPYFVCALDGI